MTVLPKIEHLVKSLIQHRYATLFIGLLIIIPSVLAVVSYTNIVAARLQVKVLSSQKEKLTNSLSKAEKSYKELKEQDQYKINQQLKSDVDKTHNAYKGTIEVYQKILDLRSAKQNTEEFEKLYAAIVANLAELKYASAESGLKDLNAQIKKKNDELAAAAAAAQGGAGGPPPPVNNAPPASGYSYQSVKTDIGTYSVAIISADLGSTRVVVDTASDSDCRDNCPVMSLGDYVSRNGAFAGINGTYFCPASYPTCAGKTNSFDLLVMNKNKKYLNSDNNVYSNNPAVIFSGSSVRYVGRALEWGRDTGVDAVISNYPLLVSGGQSVFGGDGDPKKGSKGPRSFIGSKGSTVYIGVVYNATVAEASIVLKTLGLEGAMNLDSGGSTALWHGGYKAGPGRNIPNAVLLIRR